MRKLIILTFLLPIILFLFWFGSRAFYTANLSDKISNFDYSQKNDTLLAVDGSQIKYTLTSSVKKRGLNQRPVILFISDQNRDRNWDTKGFSPSMGKRLAIIAARLGVDSIRFDMRGTGASKASRSSWTNPVLHKKDVITISKLLTKKDYLSQNITIVAHGEYGCMLALSAFQNKPSVKHILLVNCSANDIYLKQWGEQLFTKMQKRGVTKNLLRISRMEWKLFLRNGKILKSTKSTSPDIQAFRNTLDYLKRVENQSMYNFIRKFNQTIALKNLLNNKTKVSHLISINDPSFNKNSIKQLKVRTKLFDNSCYDFNILEQSDELLRQSSLKAKHFIAMVTKSVNPIISISTSFQEQFIKILSEKNSKLPHCKTN